MRHYTTKVDTFFDFTNTHLHKYFHCPIPPDFDVSNGYVVIGYVVTACRRQDLTNVRMRVKR